MNKKYEHILSPITIGGKVLKNRLLSAKCIPSQQNDFEAATAFYENFAKKGAATVTMAVGTWPNCEGKRSGMSQIKMDDPATAAAFKEMVGRVQSYGSLASASLMNVEPQDVAISDTPNWNDIPKNGDYSKNFAKKPGISLQRLEGMLDDFVFQCKELQKMGFDMVTIYMSYRGAILACSLSPLLNQRTDKYGGPAIKDRATLSLELFRRIKEACGQDFLIECQISAVEEEPGYTLEDFIEYCKLCEGLVDIFQIRGYEGSTTHLNGYNCPKGEPLNLKYAEACKKSGIKAVISPVGGFTSLDDIERFIAEGKTDTVHIARGFIADEDYGLKLEEGRGNDITPCLLCNACHGGQCAVNPEAGYTHILKDGYKSPEKSKSVAVIGGGPAGMRAAVIASKQGHDVTLYEKSPELGGQLKFAKYPLFKWPLADYTSWLINETKNSDINIRLNTDATIELLKDGQFDAIIVALGSVPAKIPVTGSDRPEIWTIDSVYGHEGELGKNVVVVGGSSSGRETALYLAECGHKVTMITRSEARLYDDMHAKRACEIRYETNENFSFIEYATTKEIGDGYIICDVKRGMPKPVDMFNGGQNVPEDGPGGPMPDMGHDNMPPPDMKIDKMPEAVNVSTMSGRVPPEVKPQSRHGEMFGMFGQPIDESNVTIERIVLEFDSIVVSGGRTSVSSLDFTSLAPEVYVIGDSVTPGEVMDCTATAYAAAMAL